MSEVRGNGLECQVAMAQERPRGATPHPRSGVAAERSYPASKVSGGREETPRVRGQGGGREELPCLRDQVRPGEATLRPRPAAVTLRSHPCPSPGLAAERSNPRSGGCAAQEGLEELSHLQGQEQWR